MVKNIIKSALVALGAIALFASCDLLKPKEDEPIVSIDASAAKFADGKVDLKIALSANSSSDVTVELADEGAIPSSALSYEKSVKVVSGNTSASVPVTVDPASLEAGSYEAVFKIASATGAKVDPSKNSCKVTLVVEEQEKPEPEPVIPVVSISAYDDEFKDNTATITLALDAAADKDITVNFAVSPYENYSPIPASAIAFDNPATVPAGSTSKVLTLTLDPSYLPVGDSWAVVSIESVSENAKVDESKKSAYLMATVAMTVEEVPEWKLSYAGRDAASNGNVYDWVLVEGWTGVFYAVALYENGTLDSVGGDIKVLMDDYQSYVQQLNNYYPLDNILRNAPTYCNFNLLDPGTYEAYLFDFTAEATVTGKYAKAQIVIEEEAASDTYNSICGIYKVTAGDTVIDAVYIQPNVNNMSYEVDLPDWDEEDQQYYYYPAIFDWDRNSGALTAVTKQLDEWDHPSYGKVEDWQYAYITIGSKNYYVTGNYTIMNSEGFKDGSFTANPGPDLQLSNGSTYKIDGLQLIGSLIDYKDEQGEGGYAFTYFRLPLPATFEKVSDLPAGEGGEASVPSNAKKWSPANVRHAVRGLDAKNRVRSSFPVIPSVRIER